MDMRLHISRMLDSMKSDSDKALLREIMEEAFIPMHDHFEEQYARLEARVRDEVPLAAGSYVIWATLMERGVADGASPYLFPMLEEDLANPAIDRADLEGWLRDGGELRIDTVFVQADYLLCREIAERGEAFEGSLRASGGELRAGIELRPSKRYADCIGDLYRLFMSNGVPWQTVYSPYIFKMFDAVLVHADVGGTGELDSFIGYDADFGSYAGYIRRGLIPMWNVRRLTMKSEDFPLPALDKVNYEYVFDLSDEGPEHGYLADYGNEDISSVRRERDAMVVTSPTQKGVVWDMYKIHRRKEYATERFAYELTSNAQEDSFAARMVSFYGSVVKTGAELRRLLAAYDASSYAELISAKVIEGISPGETYEANAFLKDEIRDPKADKTLLLEFRALKPDQYLIRDAMSFLVSLAQMMYPEYHCTGVLL